MPTIKVFPSRQGSVTLASTLEALFLVREFAARSMLALVTPATADETIRDQAAIRHLDVVGRNLLLLAGLQGGETPLDSLLSGGAVAGLPLGDEGAAGRGATAAKIAADMAERHLACGRLSSDHIDEGCRAIALVRAIAHTRGPLLDMVGHMGFLAQPQLDFEAGPDF